MCSHEMAFPSVNCTIVPTFHPQWKFPCWKWPHISPVNISEKNATVFLACFASTKEQKVAMIFMLCVCVCCKPIFMGFYVQQKEFFCPSILFFLEGTAAGSRSPSKKGDKKHFLKGCSLWQSHKKNFDFTLWGWQEQNCNQAQGSSTVCLSSWSQPPVRNTLCF